MVHGQTTLGHGQTARRGRVDPPYLLSLILSIFFLTHSLQHPRRKLSSSLSLKEKRPFLVGRSSPLIPVQPRASPVSPRCPLPFPPGISSIPLLFSPWISLPRVHNVKDEDSILDHGFVGLMVGIVL
jgi:hypothetical protein